MTPDILYISSGYAKCGIKAGYLLTKAFLIFGSIFVNESFD
jgi:hypothetical protein